MNKAQITFRGKRRLRGTSRAGLVLTIAGFAFSSVLIAQESKESRHWVGTWATGPTEQATLGFIAGENQTLRLIVHTSIGGDQVRVRLSNEFGTQPLLIGAAHIAIRDEGPRIIPGSDRELRFNKQPSISIPRASWVLSDPVSLDVPALGDLTVSIYLADVPPKATGHSYALQTSYISQGNVTGATTLPADTTVAFRAWFLLTGVDVRASREAAAIVALGDSNTDGGLSAPDMNRRWTNILASRLQANHQEIAVLNEGIGGNRVLHDGTMPGLGPSALARFDRDVVGQAGVRYVTVLEGHNDLGQPPLSAPASEVVSANDIVNGLNQLIERAHEKGLLIFGATIPPFEGSELKFPGYYTPEKEIQRQTINRWIRTAHAFDGVIDFDRLLRDPDHPKRLLPSFDGGDHVHPNDRGVKAMGDGINLSFFR
jgi:lysophospholipase L1-like esterase